MKKLFTLLIVLFSVPVWAQNTKSGSITGTTCFGIDTTNAGTVGISVQNSSTGAAWSGTIQPSASIGGDPASNISVTPAGSSAAQATITASGVYYAAVSGSTYVQVCGNTVTNTAAIKMFPAQYSKNFGNVGGASVASGIANDVAFYSTTSTIAATAQIAFNNNCCGGAIVFSNNVGQNIAFLGFGANASGTRNALVPMLSVASFDLGSDTSGGPLARGPINNIYQSGSVFDGDSTTAVVYSMTAPTISSGFGTGASIAHNNGTLAFTVNVGTGGTATSGVIGLPTAANGWAVNCTDITTNSTTVFLTKQIATSTTTATVGNFSDAAAASAWTASDILSCQATAY